jgi:hypothetical protein
MVYLWGMKQSLLIVITFLLSLTPAAFGQESCRNYFTNGTRLTYADNSEDYGVATVKRDLFIEEFRKLDLVIKSRCEWLTDCSFKLTILKIKGTNTNLKVGQSITIVITKIEGNRAYYDYVGVLNSGVKYYTRIEGN